MRETLIIAALWTGFAGSHLLLSSRAPRAALVRRLGEWPFRGVYSGVALAFFVPLAWYWAVHRHAGPLLWAPPGGAAWLAGLHAGNWLAFVLVAAGALRPSPAAIGARGVEPRGVHHVTRHAVFMGVGLWGLLHAAANGFAGDVVFFGGFTVFALAGCAHQDARLAVERGEAWRDFVRRTPFLPFTGGDTLRGLRGIPISAWMLGTALAVGLRALHWPLFR